MYKIIIGSKDDDVFRDAFHLREEVFMKEQGFNDEADDYDATSYHVVLYDDDKPVSTGRFFISNGSPSDTYTVGRICTLKDYRGKGLGKLVMEEIEKEARKVGAKKLFLSAQHTATGFYEKLGYEIVGDSYYDEHCLHFPMEKAI